MILQHHEAISHPKALITESLSEACATCTVGPNTAPAYTESGLVPSDD